MLKKLVVMTLVLLCLGISSAAQAQVVSSWNPTPQDPFTRAFGFCGDPCVITENRGGSVRVFQEAAQEVLMGGLKVHGLEIDGACASMCASAADIASPKVCITPNAKFLFHAVRVYKHDLVWSEQAKTWIAPNSPYRLEKPPESSDVDDWVMAHGGYPDTVDPNKMLVMPFSAAKDIWVTCDKSSIL